MFKAKVWRQTELKLNSNYKIPQNRIPLWTQMTPPPPQSSNRDRERERRMETDQRQLHLGPPQILQSLHQADPHTTSNTLYSGRLPANPCVSKHLSYEPCDWRGRTGITIQTNSNTVRDVWQVYVCQPLLCLWWSHLYRQPQQRWTRSRRTNYKYS